MSWRARSSRRVDPRRKSRWLRLYHEGGFAVPRVRARVEIRRGVPVLCRSRSARTKGWELRRAMGRDSRPALRKAAYCGAGISVGIRYRAPAVDCGIGNAGAAAATTPEHRAAEPAQPDVGIDRSESVDVTSARDRTSKPALRARRHPSAAAMPAFKVLVPSDALHATRDTRRALLKRSRWASAHSPRFGCIRTSTTLRAGVTAISAPGNDVYKKIHGSALQDVAPLDFFRDYLFLGGGNTTVAEAGRSTSAS